MSLERKSSAPASGELELIRGSLSHVDLTVVDLERSVLFYDRILGRLGFSRRDDLGAGSPCWSISDSAGSHFGIALRSGRASAVEGERPQTPGVHHLAFHADDRGDVDAFFIYLQSVGVTVLDAPSEYAYTPGYYAVFFQDPDGLKLEFVFEPRLRGDDV